MAPFNPQLQPINAPDDTNRSRPISDIPANKSTALAISTAAEALDTGVKVAENIDQDIIKEKTRAGVEALRDATTVAYETTRGALLAGQQPPAAAANVAGLSLLQKTAEVPEPLQAGLDRAEDLATARAQGTLKANDTLYTGALNSLAKQLRAEFPGHKDFIDEQIAKISGKNPANAYMDNLLADIKGLATGTDSVEKKIVAKGFENMGNPSVFAALKKYQAKLPGSLDGLMTAVGNAEKEKADHITTMNNFAEDEAAGKVDLFKVRDVAQQKAQAIVYQDFNGMLANGGLTPALISQIQNEYRQGKITSITPDQWEQFAQHLESMKDVSLDRIKTSFNNLGISRRLARAGQTDDEGKLIANEVQFYDRAIAAIRSPDKGLFFEMQRRSKGLQDNATYQALTGPTGDFLLKNKVLTDHAGPLVTNFVAQQALTKGYMGQLTNWFGDSTLKATVPEDVRYGNVGKSLTADIQRARAARNEGVKFDSRLYGDLVKNVELIDKAGKEGRPEVAIEVAKYMFDPTRNKDFVNQWARDSVDSKGVKHEGYFTYYDMLTNPKVADAVRNLKDPGVWDMYKNWQDTNFRTLFGNEVQALNNITTSKDVPIVINWDPDRHEMVLSNDKPTEKDQQTRSAQENYIAFARESVSKLNNGIRNLGYMYEKQGTDPNEGIFSTLMQLGYNPNDRLEGKGLPAQVLRAIYQSQFNPSVEERMKPLLDRPAK